VWVSRNIQEHWRNHYCRWKAISITYSECASIALSIQHTKRVRGIVLPYVECPTLPYVFPLSHIRHDFRGGGTKHKMLVLIFSINIVGCIANSKNWAWCHKSTQAVMLSTCCSVRLKWNLNFLDRSPCAQTEKWRDRRTDMTKLTVAFHNFANAPETNQLML
jgi:hypothetical protein